MKGNSMEKKGLEGLHVWQKSRELTVMVYKKILPILPAEEKFALSQQLRRSVQSVPANIAEAYGRYSYQEGIRFSYIARGSLEETYSHLILIKDLNYAPQEVIQKCLALYRETAKLINGYIDYLKRIQAAKKDEISELKEDQLQLGEP